MQMSGNAILITGGATGIGYAMAKYFLERGNDVLICGRRENRLAEAAKNLPGLQTITCDVTNPDDRERLLAYVQNSFSKINILINNAGIQCDIDLTKGTADLGRGESEILTNLITPMYLSALFTPMLAGRANAAIVNVTSDLAFKPEIATGKPVYCATKAGLHAFSVGQRKQLAPLGIKIIELAPPMVESELNYESRKKNNTLKTPYMLTSEEYVEQALAKMAQGMEEIRPDNR